MSTNKKPAKPNTKDFRKFADHNLENCEPESGCHCASCKRVRAAQQPEFKPAEGEQTHA